MLSRIRYDRLFLVLAGMILLVLLTPPFIVSAHPTFPPSYKLVFLFGIFLLSFPFIIVPSKPRPGPLPFLELICLYYIVMFLLPPFFIDRRWFDFNRELLIGIWVADVDMRLALTVVGGSLTVFAGFLIGIALFRSRVPRLPFPQDESAIPMRVAAVGLSALHVIALYIPAIAAIPSFGQLIGPIGFLGFTLALMAFNQRRSSWPEFGLVFYILLPLKLVWHVLYGLFTPVVLLLILLTVAWPSMDRRRLLLITGPALVAILTVIAARPMISAYRTEINQPQTAAVDTPPETRPDVAGTDIEPQPEWMISPLDRLPPGSFPTQAEPDPETLSLEHRVSTFSQIASDYFMVMKVEVFARSLLRRISVQYATLSHTVLITPELVPFWDGYTYRSLLTNNIPRLFWPDKPEERMGQQFGHRYRVLNPDDRVSSWNLPWLTETYVNYGLPRSLFAMFGIGLGLAFLSALFNRHDLGYLGTGVGCALLLPLFYQDSNLSLMVGNLLTIAALLLLCCLLANWLWRLIPSNVWPNRTHTADRIGTP